MNTNDKGLHDPVRTLEEAKADMAKRMSKGKIYVASSWRNEFQPTVVEVLRAEGYEVYDFKNPAEGDNGFHWSEIDPNWQNWTNSEYKVALNHPVALAGFKSDYDAMQWADAFVLVLPCGRSAHLELGWAAGAGKKTVLLLSAEMEPELMVKMCDYIALDLTRLTLWLRDNPITSTSTSQ